MKIVIVAVGILLVISPCFGASGDEAIQDVSERNAAKNAHQQERAHEQENAATRHRSDEQTVGEAGHAGRLGQTAGAEHRLGAKPGKERSATNGFWGRFREVALGQLIGLVAFLLALANILYTKATANEGRADAAMELFFCDRAVIRILNPEPDRKAQFTDAENGDKAWSQYQREVIRPVLDRLERLASMTNPRRWRDGMFSPALVERVASAAIQDIWNDKYVKAVVKQDRRSKEDPTIYIESEVLAKRMSRLEGHKTTSALLRWWKRWKIRRDMRHKLIEAGVI